MTTSPLKVEALRYKAMIGTGGIGAGTFFALNGDHTLGREESRSGRFLDRKDYCKLHIIAHYVRTLLGADFAVFPVGKVGDDDLGRRLESEMAEAGLDLRHVRRVPGEQTMNVICFVYPDGSGGNLTLDDSACAKVDSAFIREAEPEFAAFAGQGIGLAAPEVPLAARAALLELATRHRFLRAASFISAEMVAARDAGMLGKVDLLAINIDEAAAIAGVSAEQSPETVVAAAVAALREIQPAMQISITAGRRGSWVWDAQELTHLPAHKVEAASTAGAGDAHFAGLLAGLTAGLPLAEAHELGALAAAVSVTSCHTINKELDRESLKTLADSLPALPCPGVRALLESRRR